MRIESFNQDKGTRYERFATGKTLDESVDAFFKMSITAAVCSLFLNGRGYIFQSESAVLILNKDEKAMLILFSVRKGRS